MGFDMIEGILVEDDVPASLSSKIGASSTKARVLGIAVSLAAIMLLVSLRGWIIDDVVKDINENPDTYERVPVWERSERPYITNQSHSFVMEFGVPHFWSVTRVVRTK